MITPHYHIPNPRKPPLPGIFREKQNPFVSIFFFSFFFQLPVICHLKLNQLLIDRIIDCQRQAANHRRNDVNRQGITDDTDKNCCILQKTQRVFQNRNHPVLTLLVDQCDHRIKLLGIIHPDIQRSRLFKHFMLQNTGQFFLINRNLFAVENSFRPEAHCHNQKAYSRKA